MSRRRLSNDKKAHKRILPLAEQQLTDLVAGALDRKRVSGLTHKYYKYPARFSPLFARAAIKAFSAKGDLVVDPFAGGGTTLVEALALGRSAAGLDISSLATFVSTVKTSLLGTADMQAVRDWLPEAVPTMKVNRPVYWTGTVGKDYLRNINDRDSWRIRKVLQLALNRVELLSESKRRRFLRCALLRTGQWALDGRSKLPTVEQVRQKLQQFTNEMLEGMDALKAEVERIANSEKSEQLATSQVVCVQRSALDIDGDESIRRLGRPRLVLTSPPYPGVHILYHRWQIGGGREAPAPFWIANRLDGAGETYYTLGDRREPQLTAYYDNLEKAFSAVAKISDSDTVVVQLVAFSDPIWQLPKYLSTMRRAGFEEVFVEGVEGLDDGRLWRSVPGRRWHATSKGKTPASREVVLFHMRN